MPIPKKITPDNLKDTVVEYRFTSGFSHDVLPGLVYQTLRERFTPIPRPERGLLDGTSGFRLEFREEFQLADDSIKITLQSGNVLVFNALGQYQGWTGYFDRIKWTLDKLFQSEQVKSVGRIGIRYISEFPGISIFEQMKHPPHFLFPDGASGQNNAFKTELHSEPQIIILNLADQVARKHGGQMERFSLVDIDVFKTYHPDLAQLSGIYAETDRLHTKEKEMFFGILKEQFIQERKPEY